MALEHERVQSYSISDCWRQQAGPVLQVVLSEGSHGSLRAFCRRQCRGCDTPVGSHLSNSVFRWLFCVLSSVEGELLGAVTPTLWNHRRQVFPVPLFTISNDAVTRRVFNDRLHESLLVSLWSRSSSYSMDKAMVIIELWIGSIRRTTNTSSHHTRTLSNGRY